MYKILFIDSVTTGMNPERCAIYRLGGIFTEDGVEKKRFELRMCPYQNARISEQSLWICNETRSTLLYYPSQEDAFKDFLKLLDEQVNIHNPKDKLFLGGFNTDRFEYPFLTEWFRRNGNERFRDYFYVQTFDMMSIANLALLGHRKNLPDFYLETVAEQLGLRPSASERYDCIVNSKISLDMFRLLSRRWGLDDIRDQNKTQELFRNYSAR